MNWIKLSLVWAALMVLITQVAKATDIVPGVDEASAIFWYRALSTLVIGLVVWYCKRQDARVAELEKQHSSVTNDVARIKHVDQEIAKVYISINAVRDQVNREYHTKEETREHRNFVERQLNNISEDLRTSNKEMADRLNNLAQAYLNLRGSDGPHISRRNADLETK